MSLRVGTLISAIVCSGVYGYTWLFEMTADPVDRLQYVMDIAGRGAVVSWVVFANIATYERAIKRSAAAEIANVIGLRRGR